jgi:hypothetical protein
MTLFTDHQKSGFTSIAGRPGRTALRTLAASLIVSGLTVALVLWLFSGRLTSAAQRSR